MAGLDKQLQLPCHPTSHHVLCVLQWRSWKILWSKFRFQFLNFSYFYTYSYSHFWNFDWVFQWTAIRLKAASGRQQGCQKKQLIRWGSSCRTRCYESIRVFTLPAPPFCFASVLQQCCFPILGSIKHINLYLSIHPSLHLPFLSSSPPVGVVCCKSLWHQGTWCQTMPSRWSPRRSDPEPGRWRPSVSPTAPLCLRLTRPGKNSITPWDTSMRWENCATSR